MNEHYCCCYIGQDEPKGCDNEAEWTIENPLQTPDTSTTESCTAHVGKLLTDAPIHYVYAIRKA